LPVKSWCSLSHAAALSPDRPGPLTPPQLEELEMANHGRHVVLAEGACSGQLSLWFPKGYRVYTIYVTNEPPSLGA
jgi:hypothetical protein